MAIRPRNLRLQRLISNGYFPGELPTPFNCSTFADHAVDLAALWSPVEIRRFWTTPERYNISRYGQNRRSLAIVNPVNQLHVAHLIAANWVEIRNRLGRSEISEFVPSVQLRGRGRAVNGVDYDGVNRRRTQILSSYGRYVKTDISRFYPSVYTHSIAWSVLGKEWVKNNFRTPAFRDSFANHLDKAVSAGQNGQTIGIPIGPDTSRIISELIVTEVEIICRERLSDLNHRSVRYVDDWLIGLRDEETSAVVLSELSTALYEYQLELSAEKTTVFGLGIPHAPEWIHYIRNFQISSRPSSQRDDIDSFFAQATFLADANEKENVLLYAVKKAVSLDVDPSVSDHLIYWILYSARRSPTCLRFVAEHLAAKHRNGDDLPDDEIAAYLRQQIPIKASAAHTEELSWLLFWAIEINLPLESALFEQVVALRSGVNAVLTLDLLRRGQIAGVVDTSFWRGFATQDGLKSEMWLAAYEITKKGWWPRRRSERFVTDHNFFADIWARQIEFYDTDLHSHVIRRTPFARRGSFAPPNLGGAYR